jgi:hypothetical protein
MQVNLSLSLDTERDADILAHINWLKANKPRAVSAWLREKVRAGMASDNGLERKIDRVLALLESGAVVRAAVSGDGGPNQRDDALDKLGL